MLNRLAIVRTALVVTTIVVTAIVPGDSDDRSHGLRDYRDHSHGCRSDRGGRGSACRGVRRPADAVSVHPESEPADVPRQAMPDVRERPESVRKMKRKPGPKVRPGGAAARAWNRPWRCPWRTLPSDAGATGGSIVEEADLTNSPMSLSFSSTVLLSTFKTLASSYTRGFATNYSYSVTTRVHGRGQLVMTASLPCLIVRP